MKVSRTTIAALGALALTATTLLAGCGSQSSEATGAAEPAASESSAPSSAAAEAPAPESAAVEAPASVIDGLVQPAGVSDDVWATFKESVATIDLVFDGETGTPEEYAELCSGDKDMLEQAIFRVDDNEKNAEGLATEYGSGSVEDWSAVIAKMVDNVQRMACAMAQ